LKLTGKPKNLDSEGTYILISVERKSMSNFTACFPFLISVTKEAHFGFPESEELTVLTFIMISEK